MNKEQFAEKIIRLRKKKGYTQAQLAELLNVSNKAVSRWETAEGYPEDVYKRQAMESWKSQNSSSRQTVR